MKKAWIENNVIRDVCSGNPDQLFHPTIAGLFDTIVPDDAACGDGWVDGKLVKPEPIPISIPTTSPTLRTWVASDIRSGLTLLERVKWDNDSAPEVVTAKQEMATPQELTHITEVLALLVNAQVISQESVDKILS